MARTDRGFEGGGAPSSGISARGAARIKINTNPNKTAAKGNRNPTQKAWEREEANEPVYDKYGPPAKRTIKINTNPKPLPNTGKPRVAKPVTNHQPRIGGHSN